MEHNDDKGLLKGFEQTLNTHGYGFHYSVLHHINLLRQQKRVRWEFEAAEFPVSVQGADTRIDFILSDQRERPNSAASILLVAECKRANPSRSDWCFIRTSYVTKNSRPNRIYFDSMQRTLTVSEHDFVRTHPLNVPTEVESYNIAIELKGKKPGEGSEGRGQIENATAQVLRGSSGLAQFLFKYKHLFVMAETGIEQRKEGNFHVLPVIFTTATLWVSKVMLETADLETGNIDLSSAALDQPAWVLYQYHMSPRLNHNLTLHHKGNTLGEIMQEQAIRTVAIVNPEGVESFLNWASNLHFS